MLKVRDEHITKQSMLVDAMEGKIKALQMRNKAQFMPR